MKTSSKIRNVSYTLEVFGLFCLQQILQTAAFYKNLNDKLVCFLTKEM